MTLLVTFMGMRGDAYGWQVALILIVEPLKHGGWLIFTIPVWLGLVSPVFLKVKSTIANSVLLLCYAAGFILLIIVLDTVKAEGMSGIGYYVWILALLVLTASRIKLFLEK